MMEKSPESVVASWWLLRNDDGDLVLRVYPPRGNAQGGVLERKLPPGRDEALFLWGQLTYLLEGQMEMPWDK